MQDDAELLRRYAEESSEPAFTELVARHIDLVYSAALRQVGGDLHRAHDVAQLVFATLARKAAALRGHPVLAGWLYNTTQHIAQRAMRAEYRRRAREAEVLRMNATEYGGGDVHWERIRPVLDDAMHELAERDRKAVLLRFFARRPFTEIGSVLNLSEDAARMRVDRALDKLHALLARRGVTSTSSALAIALASQASLAAPAGLAGAIAGTAMAGTGALAGATIFMKTLTLAAGVIAIVAAGFAIREHSARQSADAAQAAAVAAGANPHPQTAEEERALARSPPSYSKAKRRSRPRRRIGSSPSWPPRRGMRRAKSISWR